MGINLTRMSTVIRRVNALNDARLLLSPELLRDAKHIAGRYDDELRLSEYGDEFSMLYIYHEDDFSTLMETMPEELTYFLSQEVDLQSE